MEKHQRRTFFWTLAGIALAALLFAVIVTVIAPDNALTWLIAALIVLVLAVIGEIVLLFLGVPGAPKRRGMPKPQKGPASDADDDLLLRCSSCAKTFTTFDDGHRPLATLCPHCGQRGVIDASPA